MLKIGITITNKYDVICDISLLYIWFKMYVILNLKLYSQYIISPNYHDNSV